MPTQLTAEREVDTKGQRKMGVQNPNKETEREVGPNSNGGISPYLTEASLLH